MYASCTIPVRIQQTRLPAASNITQGASGFDRTSRFHFGFADAERIFKGGKSCEEP